MYLLAVHNTPLCTAVVNRLEKSVDFHAKIREKFWFHSNAGRGVVQVNADKALCNASFL